jgi:hypothetical protein
MCFLLSAYAGGEFNSSLAAEGITAGCQNVGVVAEAVQQCSSGLFVAEHS